FSVSLWLMNSQQKHTTETQRTQRLHREIQVSTTCDSGWVHSHQGPSTTDLARPASKVRIIVVSNDSSFLRFDQVATAPRSDPIQAPSRLLRQSHLAHRSTPLSN